MTLPRHALAPRLLTRRRFVGIAGAGALGTAALGAATWPDLLGMRRVLASARYRARAYAYATVALEERIAKQYDYLTLDPAGVARFVADYERVLGPARERPELEEEVYTKFLMSTDFFLNGADESRTVRYVALYDPHTTPCWTPFPPASV